jgi:CBS domain containing-hemolysin-like protein
MAWIVALLIISLLIFINAFYVAAKVSTVSSRRSKLAEMAADGNTLAQVLTPIVSDRHRLDTYVATCQIGITVSSLLLGFFGQSRLTPAVAELLGASERMASAAVLSMTAALVLLMLTTLQVILGELVPKSIGIQYPERLALLTILPMRWSTILFKPLIWILNGSGRLILHMIGFTRDIQEKHTHLHTPREILMLFEESNVGGKLDNEERRLLKNSLELRQVAVRQVMIPRTRLLAAPLDQPCEDLLRLLADSPYSRLPLYEGTIDNIVGIVHLKELLCLRLNCAEQDVHKAIRPVLYVPENTLAGSVFAMLQSNRYHIAVVLDEFGGTAGLVTLEDLIEEIFGEVQDEFDMDTLPPIRAVSREMVELRGDFLIDELNETLGLNLVSTDVDTIGGWVLTNLGHVPEIGEKLHFAEISLIVQKMEGNAITAIRMKVTPEQLEQLQEWNS